MQLEWGLRTAVAPAAQVPLDLLPFPTAAVGPDGTLIVSNAAWSARYPDLQLGRSVAEIAAGIHASSSSELQEALDAGIRTLLAGAQQKFVQEYSQAVGRFRVSVAAGPGMIWILHEVLTPSAATESQNKMETVGRLLGGVVHDFANLLTLISGYSDIVFNRLGESDPLRAELDEIRKAASRGARLTGQLLGFTRGQAVQPKILDLNQLVRDAQTMLQPIIGEYIDLEVRLSPSLGKVLADAGQMEQVLMNLLLNARDALPRGGRIIVETGNRELQEATARSHGMEPGSCVSLSVSDTGLGMDSHTLEHVFEPFFTTKQEGKGTGLGLSTVHDIVRQSHGAIWVRSAPGQGTTFTICLPRVKAEPVTADTAHTKPVATGNETVLLVEDEESVRRLLSHILHRRGYQVLEASNAPEALEIFCKKEADIHLVLTDMVMPKMSGRDLAREIRRMKPEMKVIFMSGYTNDVLIRTGALSPGMSFLQKPLRPDVLAAKIREALDTPTRPFNPR
jgi:signal transduction histidine kinase/CheY-like chemotaxis protein